MLESDPYLDEKIEELQRATESRLDSLRRQAEDVVRGHRTLFDEILRSHGFSRCQKCDGTGAVERLDSGYMRRFGLREWDGCATCGSNSREERGRGYL